MSEVRGSTFDTLRPTLSSAEGAGLGARALVASPIVAAAAALLILQLTAPDYLFGQGFPLDDAWIHAVYAREFAQSAMLAYNPGVPATGETSPLWAIMLAGVYRIASAPEIAVALTKVMGFALHAASAAVLAFTLRGAGGAAPFAYAPGAIVALHPDLVAASVSGMEVPLATLIVASIAAATLRGSAMPLAALGAAAVAGRPETAAIAVLVPLTFWGCNHGATAIRLSAAAAGGVLAMGVAIALRNRAVSGMLLPATFHAKVDLASPFGLQWQVDGFRGLLGQLPLVDSVLVIALAAGLSIALIWRRTSTPAARLGGALCLSALAYCAVSFVLVHPFDPSAFYHQRYVLPALFAVVAALPILIHEILKALPRPAFAAAYVAALVWMVGVLVYASPSRYPRLSNDARNIDDVQVALGRSLQAEGETPVTAWVVDAGASRFFGTVFVVDLVGLNTPEILGPGAQEFLDARRPRYLDRFEGWSEVESSGIASMPVRSFEASTPYTVTGDQRMRRHELLSCEPAGLTGRITVRGRSHTFRCP
jgi:hypothetical protein